MTASFLIDGSASDATKAQVAAELKIRLPHADAVVFPKPVVSTTRELLEHVTLQKRFLLRIDNSSTTPSPMPWYHYRFFFVEGVSTVEEVVEDVVQSLVNVNRHFISTRGIREATEIDDDGEVYRSEATFLSVVRDGLALDGGLYMPLSLLKLMPSQLSHIAHSNGLVYQDVAQIVLEKLVDTTELPPSVVASYISHAYEAKRWSAADVCPLTPLHNAGAAAWDSKHLVSLLELYHGPTAAFKDFALQLFPYMFGMSTLGKGQYMILAATSGDTGVAAIVGFLNSSPQTKVMVLYPNNGVSAVQKAQMQCTDDGSHVRVFGVDGDFDFCQTTVKDIFQNANIEEDLRRNYQLTLSSANSINYGRLIPQVVYYFWAYRCLVQQGKLGNDGVFDVCVPSGNFGNLLSCFIGKKMGLPVRRLILASNSNDVLYEFIATGVYDISHRSLHVTASPSIDILKASNIERLLYFISDGDTALVTSLMNDLSTKKRFELSEKHFAVVQEHFWAMRCSEEECTAVMHDVFVDSKHTRVLDPHTAVAVRTAQKYLEQLPGGEHIPLVVASTAHWAKFPQPVLRALDVHGGSEVGDGVAQLYNAVCSLAPGVSVHPALQEAMLKARATSGTTSARTAPRDVHAIVEELKTFAACQSE